MYKIQVQCYEDTKLMKLFPEIVRSLYDLDVLAEDTILHWYRKGSNPKGRYGWYQISALMHSFIQQSLNSSLNFLLKSLCRQSFVKALDPFVKWLEEAEEED